MTERYCCDGRCDEGRGCPLCPARVEASKPRPPVPKQPPPNWIGMATFAVIVACCLGSAWVVIECAEVIAGAIR